MIIGSIPVVARQAAAARLMEEERHINATILGNPKYYPDDVDLRVAEFQDRHCEICSFVDFLEAATLHTAHTCGRDFYFFESEDAPHSFFLRGRNFVHYQIEFVRGESAVEFVDVVPI